MDEKHWFLNTSFSGFLLLVVFTAGSWCFLGSFPFQGLITNKQELDTLIKGAGLVVVLPFLGMIVKAFSVAFFRRWHYKALAWRVMGELARDRLKQPFSGTELPLRKAIHEALDKAQIDSLVSWLRFEVENDKITQWRRNRGHYMHFAENSLTASMLGYPLAGTWTISHLCMLEPGFAGVVFLVVFGLWIHVLWEVRTVMGQTNDEILLAWMIERMGLVDKKTILIRENLDSLLHDARFGPRSFDRLRKRQAGDQRQCWFFR